MFISNRTVNFCVLLIYLSYSELLICLAFSAAGRRNPVKMSSFKGWGSSSVKDLLSQRYEFTRQGAKDSIDVDKSGGEAAPPAKILQTMEGIEVPLSDHSSKAESASASTKAAGGGGDVKILAPMTYTQMISQNISNPKPHNTALNLTATLRDCKPKQAASAQGVDGYTPNPGRIDSRARKAGGRGGRGREDHSTNKDPYYQQTRDNQYATRLLSSARPSERVCVVVVLVGLPGCGKSTLSNAVKQAKGGENWRVVCQDVLGDRKNCEAATREHLLETAGAGSVIIDRCNFDWKQRRTWINLVSEAQADFTASGLPHRVLSVCCVLPRYVRVNL